ncbi:hypothetical protein E6H32_00420 [Candidatus Bathyarchaeota archaeon]|nr:MAG: hypothetical protein E6H32_00420 [Candidatus Bathyarchaeota archaeon]
MTLTSPSRISTSMIPVLSWRQRAVIFFLVKRAERILRQVKVENIIVVGSPIEIEIPWMVCAAKSKT